MKRLFSFLFFIVINCIVFAQSGKDYYLIAGTYTKGKSEGIYVYKFNSGSAEVSLVNKATGIKNPSFVAISPDQRFVYSVEENHGTSNAGNVVAYSFNRSDGSLTKLNVQPSWGEDPCYVTVDKTGKWVIVGNYSSGTLAVYPIGKDGSLGTAVTKIAHKGKGPNKERQEGPHVHSTVLSADNKFLFVPDLGIDKVMIYSFNAKTGKLVAAKKPFASLAPGAGPRHFDFSPNGKYAYLMQEMAGAVTVFSYDAATGGLKAIQTISSLPPDYKGPVGSADIHVSRDGRFLYASNRGESNTLAIYSVDAATGKLKFVAHQSTMGKIPRNFNFDPSGNYLLVANQESDNIVIFKRDVATGLLTDTGKRIDVGNPVCIKWADIK